MDKTMFEVQAGQASPESDHSVSRLELQSGDTGAAGVPPAMVTVQDGNGQAKGAAGVPPAWQMICGVTTKKSKLLRSFVTRVVCRS